MSQSFDRLVAIMDRLREPDGCPWDREQTLDSLTGYLLEEAHEVVEAAHSGGPEKLKEELGDLLLQIVFMARIAREREWFEVDDVADAISDKLVRRHPHVFGDVAVDGSGEVKQNWEAIKRRERGDGPTSVLAGVPAALPALLKAFRVTEKAAAVGFDWRRPRDVIAAIRAEIDELEHELEQPRGEDDRRVREEMGDVLLAIANLARHLGVEPETALQRSTATFIDRFTAMEGEVDARGGSLHDLDLEEMDSLWRRVKRRRDGAGTAADGE